MTNDNYRTVTKQYEVQQVYLNPALLYHLREKEKHKKHREVKLSKLERLKCDA